jgi:hypothetical protein
MRENCAAAAAAAVEEDPSLVGEIVFCILAETIYLPLTPGRHP